MSYVFTVHGLLWWYGESGRGCQGGLEKLVGVVVVVCCGGLEKGVGVIGVVCITVFWVMNLLYWCCEFS